MTNEQKHLKEHFLEPETRCGHYVSSDTKSVWKVLLDLVEEVDRICRKYDIKYFLIAGSLLGAIRHKGMIPWDDDIDIALFREDYEKLEKVLPLELPSHMFMQTLATDPEYPTAHMKIRDSNTSGIYPWAAEKHLRYNMGIFIDVFALDGVPRTARGERIAAWLARRWILCLRYRIKRGALGVKGYIRWLFYSAIWTMLGPGIIYKLREMPVARFKIKDSKECVQDPCDWGYSHRYRYDIADLQETVDVPFEYLMLKAPKNYQSILDKTYGDWHKIVKGDNLHGEIYLNAKMSYKEALAVKYGYTEEEIAAFK